jgi:uncharacterized membrane protein
VTAWLSGTRVAASRTGVCVTSGRIIQSQEAGMAMQNMRGQGAVVSMEARRRSGNRRLDPERLATGLGWFSIGLGLAEIVAPGMLARTIGLKGQGRSRAVTRLVGVREIASGVGILTERKPAGWVWSRVAGDVMDLALLGAGFTARRANRKRLALAAAGVLGVTVLDAMCAEQLTGVSRLSLRYEPDGSLRVRKRITVGRPAEALYRFWRDFTNLPRFMERVESVQVSGERRSQWRAKGPAGVVLEWEAEVTEERPNALIGWRALENAPVQHSGVVTFETAPAGRGTVVTVEMQYTPPGGGVAPEQQLQEDLRRFKQLMETGLVVLSESGIHGVARSPERADRPVSAKAARGGAR